MRRKKKIRISLFLLLIFGIFLFSLLGSSSHAVGFTDSQVNPEILYQRYPQEAYNLDFYVDTGWDWFPTEWANGLSHTVSYLFFGLTNFLWWILRMMNSVLNSIVKMAFSLDFLSDLSDTLAKSIQSIAGVDAGGNLLPGGFFGGFLLLLIACTGVYFVYLTLFQRRFASGISMLLSFVLVFVLSGFFIVNAPKVISLANGFSEEMSEAVLNLGSSILPEDASREADPVERVVNSVFAMQVYRPWVALQFGTTDEEKDSIGERAKALLESDRSAAGEMQWEVLEDGTVAPKVQEEGETSRRTLVKQEVTDRKNEYLSEGHVYDRLATVVILLLISCVTSLQIGALCLSMVGTQVFFILHLFLFPFQAFFAMIPGNGRTAVNALLRLFNTLISRSIVIFVVTISFFLSDVFLQLTGTYPLFLIALLQLAVFFLFKSSLMKILGYFALSDVGKEGVHAVKNELRSLRNVGHTVKGFVLGAVAGAKKPFQKWNPRKGAGKIGKERNEEKTRKTQMGSDSRRSFPARAEERRDRDFSTRRESYENRREPKKYPQNVKNDGRMSKEERAEWVKKKLEYSMKANLRGDGKREDARMSKEERESFPARAEGRRDRDFSTRRESYENRREPKKYPKNVKDDGRMSKEERAEWVKKKLESSMKKSLRGDLS
ncbi:MAG: hypothetical protein SOX70_03265 [Peptoniphilaceae bacterium]|nr:hypothetical protein [Peptoniphilaceae bacterium]